MELKSIFEIRAFSQEEKEAYIHTLETEPGYGVHRDLIASAIETVIATPPHFIPMSTAVFYSMMKFIRENYINESTDDVVITINDLRVPFTTSNIYYVSWMYDGNTRHVLLTQSQYNYLISMQDAMCDYEYERADFVLESIGEASICTIDENDYAISLGIIEREPIPQNSESLNVAENTARFSGAMWFEAIQQKVIVLAGVGGIGSYTAFLLARMQPSSLFIYDDDKVEAVNMSGQLYGKTDINKYKVDALASMLRNYANYNSVFAISQRFTVECEPADIMICGFDNMEARKLFFDKWEGLVLNKDEEGRKHCLFIDGRLAAEELQVYCVTGDNEWGRQKYRESLFSDAEADNTVCSYKQTTYMANMIGSIIVNLFTNFVANEMLGFLGRELPFFTSYDGLTMQMKLE